MPINTIFTCFALCGNFSFVSSLTWCVNSIKLLLEIYWVYIRKNWIHDIDKRYMISLQICTDDAIWFGRFIDRYFQWYTFKILSWYWIMLTKLRNKSSNSIENYVKNDLNSENTCLRLYKMYISFARVDRLRCTINNWSYNNDIISIHCFSIILTKLF